jgi:hypothetical protein
MKIDITALLAEYAITHDPKLLSFLKNLTCDVNTTIIHPGKNSLSTWKTYPDKLMHYQYNKFIKPSTGCLFVAVSFLRLDPMLWALLADDARFVDRALKSDDLWSSFLPKPEKEARQEIKAAFYAVLYSTYLAIEKTTAEKLVKKYAPKLYASAVRFAHVRNVNNALIARIIEKMDKYNLVIAQNDELVYEIISPEGSKVTQKLKEIVETSIGKIKTKTVAPRLSYEIFTTYDALSEPLVQIK